MIEHITEDDRMITHQLIFKDKEISPKTYKQLEKRIKKYKESVVLTYVPDVNEVVIILNKKCEDDKCREEEVEKFTDFYEKVLRKIK